MAITTPPKYQIKASRKDIDGLLVETVLDCTVFQSDLPRDQLDKLMMDLRNALSASGFFPWDAEVVAK